MNEEISVKFGGDFTPLGNSLRGMNLAVKGAVDEAKKSFKEGFVSIGQIISGGVILAGIHRLLDRFEELDTRAANLSISTDFLQGMQRIADKNAIGGIETFNTGIGQLSVALGEAKRGVTEYIEKFQRWGISIKEISALDTEGMFYRIADRIKEIPDPSQRAALAFELLGKSGKNLVGVMQDGATAVKSMVDQVDKLDEKKIKMLADAKHNIQDLADTATVFLGRALGGVGTVAQWFGRESMGPKTAAQAEAQAWLDAHKDKAVNSPDQTLMAKQAADILKAAEEYRFTRSQMGTDQEKLNGLVGKRHDIQAKINDLQGESVEKYRLLTKWAENEKSINELNAKITKDAADSKKKADDEHQKKLKEERDINYQIQDARHKIDVGNYQMEQASRAPYLPTLEELANSGFYRVSGSATVFQQGPFAAMARQLLNLQADAKQSLVFGNENRFMRDSQRIDDIKKTLMDAGVMSSEDKLSSIDESMSDAKKTLDRLLQKASTEGLRVTGPED